MKVAVWAVCVVVVAFLGFAVWFMLDYRKDPLRQWDVTISDGHELSCVGVRGYLDCAEKHFHNLPSGTGG